MLVQSYEALHNKTVGVTFMDVIGRFYRAFIPDEESLLAVVCKNMKIVVQKKFPERRGVGNKCSHQTK